MESPRGTLTVMRSTSPDPVAAIVVPSFRHPSLLPEAIGSALAQETSFAYRLVVVNDGCPFPQTHEVCAAYARAHGERVVYLQATKRGLSAARNLGVRVSLARWPSVEAVLFMDADDRLWPCFLENAVRILETDPRAGWVFPDLAMFGLAHLYADHSGEYSVLEHLADNYCPATSLVRREVFEAGVWFDESMNDGFEDWEFWLQAVAAGFRGRHSAGPGYRYRTRPSSGIRRAEHEKAATYTSIRHKHSALFTLRRFGRLETEERPRFALLHSDEEEVLLAGDPRVPSARVAWPEFQNRVRRFLVSPKRQALPSLLVAADRRALKELLDANVAAGLLWRLQIALERAQAALVLLDLVEGDELGLQFRRGTPDRPGVGGPAMAMMPTALLRRLMDEPGDEFLTGLFAGTDPEQIAAVSVTLVRPGPVPRLDGDARAVLAQATTRLVAGMASAPAPVIASDRVPSRLPPKDVLSLATAIFGVPAPLPVGGPGRRIGFVLASGDDRQARTRVCRLAAASAVEGWQPHLFALGEKLVLSREEWTVFASINLVDEPALGTAGNLVSLLGTMHVVVNAGCLAVYEVMTTLKRLSVRTMALTMSGPTGSVESVRQIALLEDALDAIVAPSDRLCSVLAALGVPEAKLVSEGDTASTGATTVFRALARSLAQAT